MPSSSACSSACLRTKFWSAGSSSSATILTARSRRFIWLMKRSRKTPEQVTTTSMRGRPSSSSGIGSIWLTRPRESGSGRTPTIHSTCASDSPYVLMLSVPHSTKAIDSGYSPPLSCCWRSRRRSTTSLAQSHAAVVGIACGSSACMFLPVGSTSGLRIGSPPGPGVMKEPSRPSRSAPISLSATICLRQNSQYLKRPSRSESATSKSRPRSALRIGEPPENMAESDSATSLTSVTRPCASVERSTDARTAARTPSLISSARRTSARTPPSEPR
mmetsp:Transcript_27653/g.70481  ORF Transcript_27653/g.70481 Transcript_27653/m.70481 type:complete len:274 (+) Transcript_27653:1441-2262(+)